MYRFYTGAHDPNRVSIVASVENSQMNFAAARCSVRDQFVRKHGRQLAEKRLSEGKFIGTVKVDTEENLLHTFYTLAPELAERISKDTGLLVV